MHAEGNEKIQGLETSSWYVSLYLRLLPVTGGHARTTSSTKRNETAKSQYAHGMPVGTGVMMVI